MTPVGQLGPDFYGSGGPATADEPIIAPSARLGRKAAFRLPEAPRELDLWAEGETNYDELLGTRGQDVSDDELRRRVRELREWMATKKGRGGTGGNPFAKAIES
ncbi:MAG: hypothetical protein IT379_36480, partial [Deltaproteobacteria bacterium]|nr:hypothetical protein [Deltaproteobacteria bacterium]